MKTKKPDKTVAGMAVLQDIRGLLSASRTPASPSESPPKPESTAGPATRQLEARLKHLEALVASQQADLDRLSGEKKDLEAKLVALQSHRDEPREVPRRALRPASPTLGADAAISRDVSDLEARKAELEGALSQIEGLLQVKLKDLARRIASVYAEAGDFGANRDFRRITDQLEKAENFGEFVRALTRE